MRRRIDVMMKLKLRRVFAGSVFAKPWSVSLSVGAVRVCDLVRFI